MIVAVLWQCLRVPSCGEVLDLLLLGKTAHQKPSVLGRYYAFLQPFHYHCTAVLCVYDAVTAAEQPDVLSYDRIAVSVLLQMPAQGAPAAQVAPSQVIGDYVYVFGFFFFFLVDGDLFA